VHTTFEFCWKVSEINEFLILLDKCKRLFEIQFYQNWREKDIRCFNRLTLNKKVVKVRPWKCFSFIQRNSLFPSFFWTWQRYNLADKIVGFRLCVVAFKRWNESNQKGHKKGCEETSSKSDGWRKELDNFSLHLNNFTFSKCDENEMKFYFRLVVTL